MFTEVKSICLLKKKVYFPSELVVPSINSLTHFFLVLLSKIYLVYTSL